MAWEGNTSRVCKCNDFNVYGVSSGDSDMYRMTSQFS
jgi:hypothetical protein